MVNKKHLFAIILIIFVFAMGIFSLFSCEANNDPNDVTPKPLDQNFELLFIVNGDNYATISITGKDEIQLPESPEQEGYVFDGWYYDKDVWSKPFIANSSLDSSILSDISVYAKFTPIAYTISYEVDGGMHNNPETYTVESSFEFLDAQKAGYAFLGWYIDASFTTPIEAISAGATGNLTLTAKWDTIGYTIKYHNVEGATHSNPNSYDIEDQSSKLSAASRDGYRFVGWYTDGAFTNMVTEIPVGTTGNLDLYAKWEIIEYVATFKDGDTIVDTVKFTVETESITHPAIPEHVGYTSVWGNYTLGTKDITINAVYTLITYDIVYHNVEGATNPNPSNYDVEDQPIALLDASKDYYTFEGWYIDAEFNNEVTEIAVRTTGVVNLYAKWEDVYYKITTQEDNVFETEVKVTFMSDGETVCVKTVKSNHQLEYVIPDSSFSRKRIFDGWYKDEACTEAFDYNSNIDSNLTLYANWITINPDFEDYYELSYNSTNPSTSNRVIREAHFFVATKDGMVTVYYKNNISGSTFGINVSIYEVGSGGNKDIWLHEETLYRSVDAIYDPSLDVYSSFTFEAEQGKMYYLSVSRKSNYDCSFSGYVTGEGVSRVSQCYVENSIFRTYGKSFVLPVPKQPYFDGWFCLENGKEIRVTDSTGKSTAEAQTIRNDIEVFSKYTVQSISSAEELKSIKLDGNYVLLCDIDLGGIEWTPIGSYSTPFIGSFDGNGYKIHNFKITGNVEYTQIGLFGANMGTIQNLGVENFEITIDIGGYVDNIHIGGLIGYNVGSVNNCYSSSDIDVQYNMELPNYSPAIYVGGLVGSNGMFYKTGILDYCYSKGSINVVITTVQESGCTINVGGLAGSNIVTICKSYSTTDVSVTSNSKPLSFVGGLVGAIRAQNPSRAIISQCYATGIVNLTKNDNDVTNSASAYAGGLVGIIDNGIINNCYSTGVVVAKSRRPLAGGLVGSATQSQINNCYSVGNVSSISDDNDNFISYAGGLVASQYSSTINNCYRYCDQVVSVLGKQTKINLDGIALSLASFQSRSLYVDTLGWSIDVWNCVDGLHPTLKNVGTTK